VQSDIVLRRSGSFLAPSDAYAQAVIEGLMHSEPVIAAVRQEVGAKHLSAFWGRIQQASENDPSGRSPEEFAHDLAMVMRFWDTHAMVLHRRSGDIEAVVKVTPRRFTLANISRHGFVDFMNRAEIAIAEMLGADINAVADHMMEVAR